MEPAKIDWKRVDSVFVEDELYENINAPKWVDLLAPVDSVDDTTWFCRPECNHPKTAEDFLKISSSGDKTKSPFGEWNLRDVKLKRRWHYQTSFSGDIENRNLNLTTPPLHQAKSVKAMTKSSTEKKRPVGDELPQINDPPRRLKSTLSAKNLFAGKDILGHIAEFCNELKKIAIGTKEKDNSVKSSEDGSQDEVVANDDVNQKERKPLLELGVGKSEEIEKRMLKKTPARKIRVGDEENIPFSLNLENLKSKTEDQQRVLQVRVNPPSPQCFSNSHALAAKNTTPSKALKSRLMAQQERGILQEVKQNKEDSRDEKGINLSVLSGRDESRTMDVFWFLKPCTNST